MANLTEIDEIPDGEKMSGWLETRPNRRSIRLKEYDYSQAGVYFVTICVHHRIFLFGDVKDGRMVLNGAGQVVAESWQWLATQYDYVQLDRWAIMPNHLHGIIVITGGGSRTAPTSGIKQKPLGRLIGAFKTTSTKHINEMHGTPGNILWQRNYYERIVRSEDELNRIREYIINNPIAWDLDQENRNVTPMRVRRGGS